MYEIWIHGFRVKSSTSLAITEGTEARTNALDLKKYAAGIFINIDNKLQFLWHETLHLGI